MGRYNFAAQQVHQHATQLLERSRLAVPPPWYSVIANIPPSARLTRPPLQKPRSKGRKAASRIFQPASLRYQEDHLRWEYFNDHPWELARPRVILENDGRDLQRWDWSVELDFALNRPQLANEKDDLGRTADSWDRLWRRLSGRPINGEAVVQRQHWLMKQGGMSQATAYDTARKEYYRIQHFREIERRVAREEALAVGAVFGPSPLELGMQLEDQQYEKWRVWAKQQSEARRQMEMRSSGDVTAEEEQLEDTTEQDTITEEEPPQVSDSIPGSASGQIARGAAAINL